MPETDQIDAYSGPNEQSLTDIFTDSSFYQNLPTGKQGDGFRNTVTVGFTTPPTQAPGNNITELIKISAHDVLQDVIIADVSLTKGTAPAPLSIQTQFLINNQLVDPTPEPKTFGLAVLSCVVLLCAARRRRAIGR